MHAPKQPARYAVLGVVCALALSGAARTRSVAAQAREPLLVERGTSISARTPEAAPFAPLGRLARSSKRDVPAGEYLPFYRGNDRKKTLSVRAFRIDTRPVSAAEFATFVRANPNWRRSRIKPLFAEASYLADWGRDTDPDPATLGAPVTSVSWFAAKAYCTSIGFRLPTTVEWERALQVFGEDFVVHASQSTGARSAASLWEWTADFNSIPIAGDASESVTNLFCGAGARANDASDYGAFLRYSLRSSLKADFALKNLGFRCAEDEP